jgi:dienelactone hydrolase
MNVTRILLLTLISHAAAVSVIGQTITGPDIVVVRSGTLRLRALLWRPQGRGPFPAVLFNHGRGLTPQTEGRVAGITELGRVFAGHGYVFLALFRRGEDLSADVGVFIGDLLERERTAKGDETAKKLQLRLLETDHLEDALAGLAFLRKLPEVDRQRVGVVGHSFGGSLALLVAERDRSLRAAVSFAGAAGSWEGSADLRKRLIAAARRLNAPVMFVYAENDFSVTPGKELDAEMARGSKVHRLRLFPSFGKSAHEAHWFVYKGVASWEHDVFAFLDVHMRRRYSRR